MSDIHYYSNYAETRDIDCFFKMDGRAYHFASNGYPIPWFITREKNLEIQDAVYEKLPEVHGEVDVRRDTIHYLILKEMEHVEGISWGQFSELDSIKEMIDSYAYSFKEMAQLGFVSMDLDEGRIFRVIAAPKGQVVPQEIMDMLPEVKIEDVETELWGDLLEPFIIDF